MRWPLLVVAGLAAACMPAGGRKDLARPGAYEFVAHVEAERELGAVQVDDGPAQKGTFEIRRRYPSEDAARAATVHVHGRGGADFALHPGQCTKSCGVLGATVRQAQHLDCGGGFDHEDVVIGLGKGGTEVGRRHCAGPAGTFELSSE